MEIRFLRKSGVPAAEISAHQQIQKTFDTAPFTKGWRGYPTFFVAALFHVPVPDSPGLLAPVGFISTLTKHVDTAHKLAMSVGVGGAYGGRVQSRRQNTDVRGPSQPPDLLSACGFLNFSPLRGRASAADDSEVRE